MDEYIKREDALDAVLFALVGTGLQSTAIYAIRELPTADVVPKSEVDNLKVLLEMQEKAYESLKELYDMDTEALINARKKTEVEVAREIFEAINEDCFDQFGYFEYEAYAELKKKYTEEKE